MAKAISAIVSVSILMIICFNTMPVAANPPNSIVIMSDNDFANYSASGDGSPENPWIIEDLYLNQTSGVRFEGGGIIQYCLYIERTSDHFIIRNCHIDNSSALHGIYLYRTTNGVIEDTIIENIKDSGIQLNSLCQNIVIKNNTIRNNKYGISILTLKDGIYISNNTFYSNIRADILDFGIENGTIYSGNDFDLGISTDGGPLYIPGTAGDEDTDSNFSSEILVIFAILIILVFVSIFLYVGKKSNPDLYTSPRGKVMVIAIVAIAVVAVIVIATMFLGSGQIEGKWNLEKIEIYDTNGNINEVATDNANEGRGGMWMEFSADGSYESGDEDRSTPNIEGTWETSDGKLTIAAPSILNGTSETSTSVVKYTISGDTLTLEFEGAPYTIKFIMKRT